MAESSGMQELLRAEKEVDTILLQVGNATAYMDDAHTADQSALNFAVESIGFCTADIEERISPGPGGDIYHLQHTSMDYQEQLTALLEQQAELDATNTSTHENLHEFILFAPDPPPCPAMWDNQSVPGVEEWIDHGLY